MTVKAPTSLRVGAFDYTITIGGRGFDDARLRENDATLQGHHCPEALIVAVKPGLAAGAEREVVLHEVLHACLNAAGQPLGEMTPLTSRRTRSECSLRRCWVCSGTTRISWRT